jgi:hypothetical protein
MQMVSLLAGEDHAPLAWERSGVVAHRVTALVRALLGLTPAEVTAETVVSLVTHVDYRLVAVYLHALRHGHDDVVRLCQEFPVTGTHDHGVLRYRLALAVGRRTSGPPGGQVVHADSVAAVFAAAGPGTTVYVSEPAFHPVVDALFSDLGAGFGEFVEQQLEVPGPNARIRQGTVKAWYLPDGTRVASKRENPRKPDRFLREQSAYRDICSQLGGPPGSGVPVDGEPGEAPLTLAVVPVFALVRDGRSGLIYSLSAWAPGTPLELLLLDDRNDGRRHRYLREYRRVLDTLFDHGILWGDMSPRNMLVHRSPEGDTYRILDFEKTEVRPSRVPHDERVTYCRGQAGVEELGVLCDQDELTHCLDGYFEPAGWDLESTAPLPFRMRPEVARVLHGRGVADPTLGEYNRTDLQFISVRSPDTDLSTGRRRYPGQLGFRVEHYLSAALYPDADDYDRMTTEILIAGRTHACFDGVFETLKRSVDAVECAFVVAEFQHLLDGRPDAFVPPPSREIAALRRTILRLYHAQKSAGALRSAGDQAELP